MMLSFKTHIINTLDSKVLIIYIVDNPEIESF